MGNRASSTENGMQRPQEPRPGVKPTLPNMQQFMQPPKPLQQAQTGMIKPLGGMPAMPINNAVKNTAPPIGAMQSKPMMPSSKSWMPPTAVNAAKQAAQKQINPVKPMSVMPRRPLRGMF
jgi:hypothetical protein